MGRLTGEGSAGTLGNALAERFGSEKEEVMGCGCTRTAWIKRCTMGRGCRECKWHGKIQGSRGNSWRQHHRRVRPRRPGSRLSRSHPKKGGCRKTTLHH